MIGEQRLVHTQVEVCLGIEHAGAGEQPRTEVFYPQP
jgi:hypothetical protein